MKINLCDFLRPLMKNQPVCTIPISEYVFKLPQVNNFTFIFSVVRSQPFSNPGTLKLKVTQVRINTCYHLQKKINCQLFCVKKIFGSSSDYVRVPDPAKSPGSGSDHNVKKMPFHQSKRRINQLLSLLRNISLYYV